MKQIISISLGSSERDHAVETEILGEKVMIERRGTDGDMQKAIHLFAELDGKVDAFGLGGIDLYIYAGEKRYTFRDAKKMVRGIRQTPIVDGSGLKNTLERKVVHYLAKEYGYDLRGKKALMVCAVDRFGMAEALIEEGCEVTFGDLIFSLGLPIPLHSMRNLHRLARVIAPMITQLPFKMLYPTGEKQNKVRESQERYARYYQEADIIAGDFHYIRKYLPQSIQGKVILTNTVTSRDVELLRERGASLLITTTPNLNGRSFGTNVMEGVLVSLSNKKPSELSPGDYDELLEDIGFVPRVEVLNPLRPETVSG